MPPVQSRAVPEPQENTPANVFMHVISSPIRIIGSAIVGLLALLFGIFVYPGNERVQNVILSKLETRDKTPQLQVSQAQAPQARTLQKPVTAADAAKESGETFTEIGAALAALWPAASPAHLKNATDFHDAMKPHSAFVVTSVPGRFWMLDNANDPTIARERTLERCHVAVGVSCFVVSLDKRIVLPTDPKKWQPQTTGRLAYLGKFRADMVPGLRPESAGVAELYGRDASNTRILVIDSRGGTFLARDETSEKLAETKAFRDCTETNAGRAITCVLYAAQERVIFNQRITAPRQ